MDLEITILQSEMGEEELVNENVMEPSILKSEVERATKNEDQKKLLEMMTYQ